MALKKTTVMVDEGDLALVREAAVREGRPASEYFRQVLHIAALRTRRWDEEREIPSFDFGHAVTADEVHRVMGDCLAERLAAGSLGSGGPADEGPEDHAAEGPAGDDVEEPVVVPPDEADADTEAEQCGGRVEQAPEPGGGAAEGQ